MANYASLKAAIQEVIKTNGNNEITGALLQQSLLAMINALGGYYQFAGIATPTTNPGTPDQNVFYLASTAGTYSNFGSIVIAENEAAILKYNGTWSKDSSGFATSEKVSQLDQFNFDLSIYGGHSNYLQDVFINGSNEITSDDGWRVTDFIPYTPGSAIVWRFGYGAVTSSKLLVFYNANKRFVNYISASGFTNQRAGNWNVTGAAYIRASYYKTINGEENLTPVSLNGVAWEQKEDSPGISLDEIRSEMRWKKLPLGKLVNCDTSAGELVHNSTYDPIRVTGESILAIPVPGARVRFRSPKTLGYTLSCFFWYGGANGTINLTEGTELWNNGVIQFPDTAKTFRIVFRATTGREQSNYYNVQISADDIQQMIDSGELSIEYEDTSDLDTMERNLSLLPQVTAAKRVLNIQDLSGDGFDGTAVFAHISDLHGDAMRFRNCMEYCDSIGGVDAVLNSGDSTLYDHPDGTAWLLQIGKGFETKMLFCIGNHESLPTGQSTLFADNIEELAHHYDYMGDASVQTTHCYYFKDFAQKKMRVIVLNYYESGVYNGRIGQNQITWFINTLRGTPAGYGVIVMLHSPEDKVVAPSGLDTFMQPSPKYGDTYQPNGFYVGNRPIMQIIDAFIGRTTLSTTYSDHSATYNGSSDVSTELVTINADFTSVASGVEFIAYVCGHRHEDNTGYYRDSQRRQLCLDITCGIGLYGDATNEAWANQSDLPRFGSGVTQDAFNIYGIDRVNGCVKIVRIGATFTIRMAERGYMEIPYK